MTLLGGEIRTFFQYSGEKKKKREKASQKIKYKYVCMYEHNLIITAYSGCFQRRKLVVAHSENTYGDFIVFFVLKIMICLQVPVVYVSVYISFLSPVLFSEVSSVKFLHETIDTFSARCGRGKKALRLMVSVSYTQICVTILPRSCELLTRSRIIPNAVEGFIFSSA